MNNRTNDRLTIAAAMPLLPLPWAAQPANNELPAYVFTGNAHSPRSEVAVCYGYGAPGNELAAYIVHACNAYPQLVEALRDLLVAAHGAAHANESDDANFYNHIHTAHNLLRSLGEKV